jgi:hypothetical protein
MSQLSSLFVVRGGRDAAAKAGIDSRSARTIGTNRIADDLRLADTEVTRGVS